MRILVACEESQAVTKEMRKMGHEAYSCDILECSGGHPEWHIQGDALDLINGRCTFLTMDGQQHRINEKWDMLIAHPPCTYMSNAGAARLFKKIDGKTYCETERLKKGFEARKFFMKFYNADCLRVAVENPVPMRIFGLPKYTQIIQPYEYGHPYSKKTCLWLKGLPALKPTNIVRDGIICWVSGGSKDSKGNPRRQSATKFRDSKTRSKTFTGIAKAMAEQWAGKCEEE